MSDSVENPSVLAGVTGAVKMPQKPTSNEDIDKLIADLVKQQIEGASKVDTSKEEELIKQQLEDKLGASLVGQRASMGRAGFAASGALGAMEGDIQRQARQQIAEDILGTRSKAKGEAFDRALQSIGVEQKMREAAQQQTINEALLKMLGQDTGGGENGGAAGDGNPFSNILPPRSSVDEPLAGANTMTGGSAVGKKDAITVPATGRQYKVRQSAAAGDVMTATVDVNGQKYRVYRGQGGVYAVPAGA